MNIQTGESRWLIREGWAPSYVIRLTAGLFTQPIGLSV